MARISRKDERVKKIIETTYALFLEKGVDEIGVREIAKANNCETASLYFFMDSRENVVQTCIDYGLKKVNEEFIGEIVKKNYSNPDELLTTLKKLAKKYEKDMRFAFRIQGTPRYTKTMHKWFANYNKQYEEFVEKLAKSWNVSIDELKPLTYLGITVISTFMSNQDSDFANVQLDYVFKQMKALMK